MGICVLCGENRKLTDEHIWSDSLLRVFDTLAPSTIDGKRGIVHLTKWELDETLESASQEHLQY